jgi:HEAT repeats
VASAAPPPSAQLDLDGDGRPEAVTVLPDGELTAGARRLGVKLETPVWRLVGLDGAAIPGGAVVVATYLDEDGRKGKPGGAWGDAPAEVVILSGGTAVWRGKIGPSDRDDERAVRLAVVGAALLRYETRRDLTHCDGSYLRLALRRFDPASRTFRPASLAADLTGAKPLRAVARGTTTQARTFRAVAATSMPDDDGEVENLGAPIAIDDGDGKTAWSKARGGWGRGETFVYRAPTSRYPVRGLAFVPGAAADHRPTQLVVAIAGERFAVELPDRGAQWIELPAPVATACVEVTLAAVAEGKSGRTSIAELAVVTDHDAAPAGAGKQLAAEVAAGGEASVEAERLIGAGGPALLDALLDGAAQREPTARRRVALALARLGDPRGAAEIAWALRDASEAEGDRLADALARIGAPAQPALAALLADDAATPPARARAARLLGRLPDGATALEAALGRPPREVRTAVLTALATRGELARARAAADAEDPDRAGDAWLVWARIAKRSGASVDPALLAILGDPARPYPLRYRAAQAAAILGEVAALRAALAQEPEPAVKEAALAVLDPAGRALAASLVGDPDPGVRAAALRAGADDDAAIAGMKDPWPVVRRAALRALGEHCGGAEAIHGAAIRDRDEATRRDALSLLARCRDPRTGSALLAAVRDAGLSPPLRAFAVALAADVGDARLVAALAEELDVLRHQIPMTESEGQIRVAVALAAALGKLKDARATRAIAEAASDPAVPPIQAAALTSLGELCPAGATPLLRQAAASDDALVARAAKGALRRCRR